MSKLHQGEVAVILAGTEYTLKPSLQAFSVIASRYDSYGQLLSKIAAGSVPAILFTLRHGLGWGDQQAKKLPELVMKTGISGLADPLSDFVYRLFNGGKSVDEVMAQQVGGSDGESGEAAGDGEENPLLAG